MPTSAAAVGRGIQGQGLQMVPSAMAGREAVAAGSGSWKEFFTWEFEQKRLNEVKNARHTMKAEKEHFQISPASSAPHTHSRRSQRPPLLPRAFWGFMAPHHRGELCLGSEATTTTWRNIITWCPHLFPSIPTLPWLSRRLPTEPTQPFIAAGKFQHLPAGRESVLLRSQPCSGVQRVIPVPRELLLLRAPPETGNKPASVLCRRRDIPVWYSRNRGLARITAVLPMDGNFQTLV